MPKRLKKSEVKEIRIVDRPLENGRHESTAYILAGGHWYRDVRTPDGPIIGDYDGAAIIREFIAFQELYERVEQPPDYPPRS